MPGADGVCLQPRTHTHNHMHMHMHMHMHIHMHTHMHIHTPLRLLCTRLGARQGTRLLEGTLAQQAARSRTAQPSACSRRLSAQADGPATVAATLALPALALEMAPLVSVAAGQALPPETHRV